jgi:CBS domain
VAETSSRTVDTQKRYPWEFWLVVGMLISLLILILTILQLDISKPDLKALAPAGQNVTFRDLIEYDKMMLENRKDILSIIIAAFGAWVGAGAAYFFGRENLRVAANSLLAMKDLSPRERLRQTSIKQIPPTPIDGTVTRETKVSEVRNTLNQKPERWFVPVVKKDGTLDTVINEEAVWRFLLDKLPPESAPADVKDKYANATVGDLLAYIDENEPLKRFNQIHTVVAMDTSVGAANDLMDSRNVFLAIVTSEGKPTHFFTTTDVRKLLLQE